MRGALDFSNNATRRTREEILDVSLGQNPNPAPTGACPLPPAADKQGAGPDPALTYLLGPLAPVCPCRERW
ncbi:MAG TPA: hypothetical protein VH164_07240 [Ktedonobacteraceae bacterium]|nr:hypothetical protein [Ktedonobacteraceae bacterium]